MLKLVMGENGKMYPYILKYDDDYGTRNGKNGKATFIVNVDNAVAIDASFLSTFTMGDILDTELIENMGGIITCINDLDTIQEYIQRFNRFVEREKSKIESYEKFKNNL